MKKKRTLKNLKCQFKLCVATPIDSRKLYCWDEFVNSLRKIILPKEFAESKIVLCDTSNNKEMEHHIKKEYFEYLYCYTKKDMDKVVLARNMLKDYFIKEKFTHLFFVDADIIAPKNTIQSMIKRKADIVTAMCPIFHSGQFPIPIPSAKYLKDGNYYPFPIEKIDGNCYEIDLMGLGCCLITRKVLEKYKFRCERDSEGKVIKSEDQCFSEDLRKKYKLWFDTNVSTKHKILGTGHWDMEKA